MKKLLFFVMAAAMFCGCDKEEGAPCPVTGVELPASSAENPVQAGTSVTIQGSGFTAESEIWLRAVTRAADVQAEVIGTTATAITFVAPPVSGAQTVLLKQHGGVWPLGEIHFAEGADNPGGEIEILPKRISHVRITWPEDMTFVLRYTYDAEGRIVAITETDRHYIYEGASDEPLEDLITTVEYASDRIVVTEPYGARSVYTLTDGRTATIDGTPGGGSYPGDYTFSYDENGYITQSTWTENPDGEYGGEWFYTVVNGSLVRVQEKENSQSDEDAIYENDPVQFNNLNIDLFGMTGFISNTDLDKIFLFGAGGNRFKTLPTKIDYEEDGIVTYRYKMDGDYIARIEIFEQNELTDIWEISYDEQASFR